MLDNISLQQAIMQIKQKFLDRLRSIQKERLAILKRFHSLEGEKQIQEIRKKLNE